MRNLVTKIGVHFCCKFNTPVVTTVAMSFDDGGQFDNRFRRVPVRHDIPTTADYCRGR
jgi:hypothetical protein